MSYQTILEEFPLPNVALIRLSRPDAANALSKKMAEELAQAVRAANKNKQVRALILTGAGEKAFCAGADLKERKGMDKKAWDAQHHAFEEALHTVLDCKKPVIAAVNGAAMGGGLELALACDFIYASENAIFALPEVKLGIMPGLGGATQLARAIGIKRAKELLFSGRNFTASEALNFGMVNKVVSLPALLEAVLLVARTIVDNAPLSLAAIKSALNENIDLPLEKALKLELKYYQRLLETSDRHEGINAFNEKRKPRFTGQ